MNAASPRIDTEEAEKRYQDRLRRLRPWGGLTLLGFIGLIPMLGSDLEWLWPFMLFFLTPWVLTFAAARSWPWPLPGPAERRGALWSLLNYSTSLALSLINPFQVAQMVRQFVGDASARLRVRNRRFDTGSREQTVGYRLPFSGEWFVYNGGRAPETSHSWGLIAQRYAYDFVVADEAGRRHRDDGSSKEHYFAYGREILAPADGTVVRLKDGVRDAPRPGTGWVDCFATDFRGNFVVIRHSTAEYSLMAHLIPGSITVGCGDRVRAGQPIGRCGNSGHSTEPHLHFQIQDHPDFFRAAGIPIAFSRCTVNGESNPEPVYLRRGMRVAHDVAAEIDSDRHADDPAAAPPGP